jgi:hypothetical protein
VTYGKIYIVLISTSNRMADDIPVKIIRKRETGKKGKPCTLDDLVPISGYPIPVYDKSSFPPGFDFYDVSGVPYHPIGVMADRVSVITSSEGTYESVEGSNVLIFHGISSGGKWVPFASSGETVEDIIEKVERSGLSIDALFVCNPGGHALPRDAEGKHKYTYVTTDAQGYMHFEDGILDVNFHDTTGGENTNIKGERPRIRDPSDEVPGRRRIRVTEDDFRRPKDGRIEMYRLAYAPEEVVKVEVPYTFIMLNPEKFRLVE